MAILTNSDVKKYGRIDKEFPSCNIQDLDDVEWSQFEKRFGLEFYDVLKADRLSNAKEWETGNLYLKGTTVTKDGKYYIATQDTGADITDNISWKEITNTKFITECYEKLWCNGLARYLALSAIISSVDTNTTKLSAAGVVQKFGSDFRPASDDSVKGLKLSYITKRTITLKRVTSFIQKAETDCYDLCTLKDNTMACGCTNTCSCSSSKSSFVGMIVPSYDSHTDGHIHQTPRLYKAAEPKTNIKGYNSLEEGYAQPEIFFYLVQGNGDGETENTLKVNPNGTINNMNGQLKVL